MAEPLASDNDGADAACAYMQESLEERLVMVPLDGRPALAASLFPEGVPPGMLRR